MVSQLPASPPGERLDWEGACSLLVRDGRAVAVELRGSATAADASLAVSGSGLALLLVQRSLLVLHGSCVAYGDRAVCLLGPSGVGKSTLAAALQGRGYRLISDAMTVLRETVAGWRALPGWSTMKLWPASVARLGWQPRVQGAVHSESDKLVCAAPDLAVDEVALHGMVSVVPSEPVALLALRHADSLVEVIKNHYLAEHGLGARGAEVLAACGRLLSCTPLRRLQRGVSLDQLDAAAARVDEWLRST